MIVQRQEKFTAHNSPNLTNLPKTHFQIMENNLPRGECSAVNLSDILYSGTLHGELTTKLWTAVTLELLA